MRRSDTCLNAVRAAVERLQKRGADVALRNGYGRYGLSTKNEGRDISPLLKGRELRFWVEGFEQGWNEKVNEVTKGDS